jgi:hypothetical protein
MALSGKKLERANTRVMGEEGDVSPGLTFDSHPAEWQFQGRVGTRKGIR